MMKCCTQCKSSKPVEEFTPRKGYPLGRGTICKFCTASKVNQRLANPSAKAKWNQARQDKQDWINQQKSAPCVDCGKTFQPCCMDFDHVRGEKHKGIGRMVLQKTEILEAEISKCDLVCACCHRLRTKNQLWSNPNKRKDRVAFMERVNVLKAHSCLDCGERLPPEALDFDHVRGNKLIRVSRMISFPWAKVLEEIAKCDLVCANCHRIRTQRQKNAHREAQKVAA